MTQDPLVTLLGVCVYYLVGIAAVATKSAFAPAARRNEWTPAGMMRHLEKAAEKDRDLDEGLTFVPWLVAGVAAFFYVGMLTLWPVGLVMWLVKWSRKKWKESKRDDPS